MKHCLVCPRSFHDEETACHACELPLIDTSAIVPIQRIEYYRAMVLVTRRYEAAMKRLQPPTRRVEIESPLAVAIEAGVDTLASVLTLLRATGHQMVVGLVGSKIRNA